MTTTLRSANSKRLPSPVSVMAALKRAGMTPRLRVDTHNGIWEVLCADDIGVSSEPRKPDIADLIDGVGG